MNKKDVRQNPKGFPLGKGLSKEVVLTFVITELVVVTSLAGLLFQEAFYPKEALREGFLTTDVINLVLGVPLLLGSIILCRKSHLLGFLLWMGALLLVIYHYVAYAVSAAFSWQFSIYVFLVLMSAYALIRLIKDIDRARMKEKLAKRFPVRFTVIVLILFGFMFLIRSIDVIWKDVSEGMSLPPTEFADLILSPIWILGGVFLWKRTPLGYVWGTGLLIHASALFLGLLIYFFLQPIMFSASFPTLDFLVILVMGCFFFVPTALLVKGMLETA